MCCTPALETITSMPPSSRAQRATPASTWSSRVTSIAMPRPRSSRPAASAPAAFTSATQTRAPSRANACAMARPIPLAAPVTSATLPESRMESSLARGTIPCRDERRVVGKCVPCRSRCKLGGCRDRSGVFARSTAWTSRWRRARSTPSSAQTGAGKTTLFNCLSGFLQPTEGTVELFGETIAGLPPHQIVDRGLSRSFQISSVFETLTVLENLVVALQARTGHPVRFWEPREALREFEPRARKIAKSRTVVFVEHNMGVVAKLADRITVLARGQVLAAGNYEQIRNDPRVIEAYLGEEVRA